MDCEKLKQTSHLCRTIIILDQNHVSTAGYSIDDDSIIICIFRFRLKTGQAKAGPAGPPTAMGEHDVIYAHRHTPTRIYPGIICASLDYTRVKLVGEVNLVCYCEIKSYTMLHS